MVESRKKVSPRTYQSPQELNSPRANINQELHPNGELNNPSRIRKKCFGCGDIFACFPSEDYDYCKSCEINGSRYIPGRFSPSKCSECGNGLGIIKFPHQPPRPCKLCSLNSQINMNQTNLHKQNSGTVKIHELTGFITGKEPYKVYHKDSPYHGNLCYKLSIVLENNSQQSNGKTAKLFIYPNLVRPEIYQAIEQTQYIDKHYHLFCEKKKKGWILHNWKPLTNHEKK